MFKNKTHLVKTVPVKTKEITANSLHDAALLIVEICVLIQYLARKKSRWELLMKRVKRLQTILESAKSIYLAPLTLKNYLQTLGEIQDYLKYKKWYNGDRTAEFDITLSQLHEEFELEFLTNSLTGFDSK
ncbi:6305_t:CDS:2 [Entrophospora sp. SA101]|nr:5808_t:CDS:2 [Entrophospora sp. SA101]CAJ0635802.1 6305_t:CDS:2 [Entrophospora sp. SA101]CAJ0828714.1 3437_t:CDS:2 [Entrophospora sp. SA101]CAJ0840855.1 5390_t:CDS:2 [Entrophospora sp. SA101]